MSDLVKNPEDRFSHNKAQMQTDWAYNREMPLDDADGMANSADPDQTTPDETV